MSGGRGEAAKGLGQVAKSFGQVASWETVVSLWWGDGWCKVSKVANFFCARVLVWASDGMSEVFARFGTKTRRHEAAFLTVGVHGAVCSFYKGGSRPLCAHTDMRIFG